MLFRSEHTLEVAGDHGGFHFGYEAMPVTRIFADMLATRRYAICEFSLANYLVLRGTGSDWLVALPVFPQRAFRHALVVTRCDSALDSLSQLGGCRVGVEDYSMTAAVWVRGLLRSDYGVDHREVTWVTGSTQRLPFPAGARIEVTGDDLEGMLLEGRIDAMLGFSTRDSRLPRHQRRLRPLLRDAEGAERAYHQRTGIYPINHCVVLRRDVLDARPGIAQAVADAYAGAKRRAYARRLGATLAPWGREHRERAFDAFGGDPLPYGMGATNRMVVRRLADDLAEQGFIAPVADLDALFLPIRA